MLTKIQRRGIHGFESIFAGPAWVGRMVSIAALSWVACARHPQTAPPESPSYSLEEAAVFTDLFRPELFNVVQSEPPERDGLLAERTEYADSVLAARCISITRGQSEGVRSYSVIVAPAGDLLAGRRLSGPITLQIPAQSPASAWLDTVTEGWVGTRFILFLRYYADGPHFFATVDSPAVRLAIARATALRGRTKAPTEP